MTAFGKLLVFVNLILAAALVTWGLSAFAHGSDWLDKKDAPDPDGEITKLKKDIERLSKAAATGSEGHGVAAVAAARADATRDFRRFRLDAWLREAQAGTFKVLPVIANDPSFWDVDPAQDKTRPAILDDTNQPLRGLDFLQKAFEAELRQGQILRGGTQPAQPNETVEQLLVPDRLAGLGINDLRVLHAQLSVRIQIADVAVGKQRVILTNLGDESAYLKDARIDWTARLETLERRNAQLRGSLKQLGAE